MAEGKYVSVAEVKELLTAENERRGELIPSLRAAMNTAIETCPLTKDQADELIAKIIDILSDISLADKDATAVKIADTLPRFPSEVRAIFAKERGVTLSPEMIQQIIDAVAEYA
ncbi:MAG: hypothetical protein MJZ38_03550 [archaeon]|nr:hypothetical protein [archaeon]